jgi:hypothetical protein
MTIQILGVRFKGFTSKRWTYGTAPPISGKARQGKARQGKARQGKAEVTGELVIMNWVPEALGGLF